MSGALHVTDLGDGTVHRTTTTTGRVSFVPDDPSQASFSGHLAESRSEHTNPRNAIETNAENVVAHGSDGWLGKQHMLIHTTVNANGTGPPGSRSSSSAAWRGRAAQTARRGDQAWLPAAMPEGTPMRLSSYPASTENSP